MKTFLILLVIISITLTYMMWPQKVISPPSPRITGKRSAETSPQATSQPGGQSDNHLKIQAHSAQPLKKEAIEDALHRIEKITDSTSQDFEIRELAPFVPPEDAEFFLDQVAKISSNSFLNARITVGTSLLQGRNSPASTPELSLMAETYARIIKSSSEKNNIHTAGLPATIAKRLHGYTNNTIEENVNIATELASPNQVLDFTSQVVKRYPPDVSFEWLTRNPGRTTDDVWSWVFYGFASEDPNQALHQINNVPEASKKRALLGLEEGWKELDIKGYTAWRNQGK